MFKKKLSAEQRAEVRQIVREIRRQDQQTETMMETRRRKAEQEKKKLVADIRKQVKTDIDLEAAQARFDEVSEKLASIDVDKIISGNTIARKRIGARFLAVDRVVIDSEELAYLEADNRAATEDLARKFNGDASRASVYIWKLIR